MARKRKAAPDSRVLKLADFLRPGNVRCDCPECGGPMVQERAQRYIETLESAGLVVTDPEPGTTRIGRDPLPAGQFAAWRDSQDGVR